MAGGALLVRLRARADLGLWPAALALGLVAAWHAATPGPTFDGWHGLGWRAIGDPAAPPGLRLALAAAALALGLAVARDLRSSWPARAARIAEGRRRGVLGLLAAAGVGVGLRQWEFPGVEPVGYWPRACFDLGILALGLALARSGPLGMPGRRLVPRLAMASAWAALVVGGIALTTYHRPLARLHAVVPGRIYISAMPTYRGLEIEQKRLGFRTIINLFDEASSQASPRHPDELRFVREHGLRYLGSPSDGLESDRFLDETLEVAQDPAAWPILVHCHGCMDRSPAWMGLYRFLIEGKPLADALREIERHRGTRPKAVVTLQYNRKVPLRAPERYATDPAARLLTRNAATTRDPFVDPRLEPDRHRPRASSPGSTPTRRSAGLDRLQWPFPPRAVALTPPRLLIEYRSIPAVLAHDPAALSMTPRTALSAAADRTEPPVISEFMQTALANPGLISLAAGFVDQASLPAEAFARTAAAILADPVQARKALQYGTTVGDATLRRELVRLLERNEQVTPGTFDGLCPRMVVTTGSAQLLYLVAEALLDPGDIVLVEAPTYFVFLGVLETRGARAIGIPIDEGGMRLDALEATLADLEAGASWPGSR